MPLGVPLPRSLTEEVCGGPRSWGKLWWRAQSHMLSERSRALGGLVTVSFMSVHTPCL